jgi:Cu/Ag efflux pump CusA
VFQQADFVKLAISNLTQALVLGFILVVVILALFLFEWRMALISLLTIPLSLVATLLVLYWRGATINTMTLAGLVIALGAVVDDAIIDVENITRRLREERLREGAQPGGGRTQKPTREVILNACLEVRSPIVYATLIIVAASVPVFLLAGLTGAFFRPLALSYTLAIGASILVALTLTPALALLMLRGVHLERRKSPLVGWLQKGYTAGLRRIIVRPVAAYATVAALTVLGIAVYPQLGQSLFPGFKEHDFLIHWVSPPGTSAAEMERSTTRISKELLAIPGVRSAGAHIGQALLGEEVAGVNLGEIWISLAPNANYTEALDRIHSVTLGYPGVFREVQTYLDERISEVLTGGKEPIVVRTYGEDLKTLRAKSDQILNLVKSVPGVIDAHRDISSDVPQANVTVNLAKAEKYGLKPGDVRRDAATLVAGEEVGDIFRAGKAYDVVVWSPERTRHSFTDIGNLPIDLPSAATSGWVRSPRSRCSRTPTPSTGRVTPGTSTWGRPWRAATWARWSTRSGRSWVRCNWPAGTTWSCWASTPSGRRRRAGCWSRRSSPACSSCCCSRPRSGTGGWPSSPSSPCRWRWSAACWRPGWPSA